MTQTIEVRKVNPLYGLDVLVGEAENEATAKFIINLLSPPAHMMGWGLYYRIIEDR